MRSKIFLFLVLLKFVDNAFTTYLLVEINDNENDKKLQKSDGSEISILGHSFRSDSATSVKASGSHDSQDSKKNKKASVKNNDNENINPGRLHKS